MISLYIDIGYYDASQAAPPAIAAPAIAPIRAPLGPTKAPLAAPSLAPFLAATAACVASDTRDPKKVATDAINVFRLLFPPSTSIIS